MRIVLVAGFFRARLRRRARPVVPLSSVAVRRLRDEGSLTVAEYETLRQHAVDADREANSMGADRGPIMFFSEPVDRDDMMELARRVETPPVNGV